MAVLRDEAEGSLVSVYLSSTVLLEEFTKLRPRIGETVGIRYLGKDEERGYHRYKLMVEREVDVDAFFGVERPARSPEPGSVAPGGWLRTPPPPWTSRRGNDP